MRRTLAILAALSLAACTQAHDRPPVPAVGTSVTEEVGPEGGTLALAGVEVGVPPGALPAATTITIRATDEPAPAFLTPYSPVLRFEPEGLEFARPIEVRIPFAGDPASASVFWSARRGDAYVARTARIEDGFAVVSSTHFSSAFVGAACEGGDCCGRANGLLDVLLTVDSSNSMAEEQASLQAQIPRLARALATGDSDGDGVQDFPALESVRLGVVSTDMGAGGIASVPTCELPYGDDGLLRTAGRTDLPGCAPSYPAFAELGADSTEAEVDGFVDQVRCVGTLGTGGCGFEQPLDATLKAVTPASFATTFPGGTRGHADGANAGFLREGSQLAIVVLTDEDDCSVLDPGLLDPASTTYTTDLNLRCHAFPEAVQPVDRYVGGLLGLRAEPADLLFATIGGAPPDAVMDPAALLEDPRMAERIDPAMPSRLTPSCDVAGVGMAFPPRRLVGVARGLEDAGARAVIGSICQDDFTPVLDAILEQIAARARGECG